MYHSLHAPAARREVGRATGVNPTFPRRSTPESGRITQTHIIQYSDECHMPAMASLSLQPSLNKSPSFGIPRPINYLLNSHGTRIGALDPCSARRFRSSSPVRFVTTYPGQNDHNLSPHSLLFACKQAAAMFIAALERRYGSMGTL
ncbi:hypothetical protein ACRALDRAFT_205652 [Sodiomyces alcalophilus JCM 7366]|uniref:uncharacterized protein n=1 Tax=Sodiomyces alcalophilus JCM 7366 TaxID=591952 RepID=UPI0039B5156A